MVSPKPTPATEQLGLPTLLAFFLVPGALTTVVYDQDGREQGGDRWEPGGLDERGHHDVLLPIELGVILRAGRGHQQRIRSVVPYRRPLPIRDWLWLVPVLVVVAGLVLGRVRSRRKDRLTSDHRS